MKVHFKRAIALLLTLLMLMGSFTCFAYDLNADAVAKHKGQYKNYLLLGDSVASGYRDEMTDNDSDFDEKYNESVYWRVPGSYADVIANAIIEDKSMTAFAAPGFRTIEIRYMLEDDYAENCTDEYLFHPSQLNVYKKYGYLPGDERIRKAYQQAVANADLITLGVGGNDWGAYLGWVLADVLEEENVADKYIKQVEDIIANSDLDLSTFEDLVEIAHTAGALPKLLETIPEALNYGLGNFYKNWDIMIEDIYNYNPDVTLMVLGMSDTSVKGKHFDYDGIEGEPVETEEQSEAVQKVIDLVVDFIMSVGNKPMIEGAEKYGYTYVDTEGTTYLDSHPDAGGHVIIADKVIQALPDPEISKKFSDVTTGHKYYNAIEYAVLNGIMSGTSETEFSPNDALSKVQLAQAINALGGTSDLSSSDSATTYEIAFGLLKTGTKKGVFGFFKSFRLAVEIISNQSFDITSSVTRAQAAKYFKQFSEI